MVNNDGNNTKCRSESDFAIDLLWRPPLCLSASLIPWHNYVRKYGHPSLFVTVTTNLNWPEISNLLSPGQHSHDRPDVVVRVNKLKLQKLMKLLKDGCLALLGHGFTPQSFKNVDYRTSIFD